MEQNEQVAKWNTPESTFNVYHGYWMECKICVEIAFAALLLLYKMKRQCTSFALDKTAKVNLEDSTTSPVVR